MGKRRIGGHWAGTAAATVRAIECRVLDEGNANAVTEPMTMVEYREAAPDWSGRLSTAGAVTR